MKNVGVSIVVLLVLSDGMVLMLTPSTHASLVNRWNALLGISSCIPVNRIGAPDGD